MIALRAIRAYGDAVRRGGLIEPEASEDLMREVMEGVTGEFSKFAEMHVIYDSDGYVLTSDLDEAWRQYTGAEVVTDQKKGDLKRYLASAAPNGVVVKWQNQRVSIEGKQKRVVRGIELTN